jgi:hypothetical protein
MEEKRMDGLAPEQVADLVEFGEADPWASYYLSAPDQTARQLGVQARRVGTVWVTLIAGLDMGFFNRISGLGLREPVTESLLDDCIGLFRDAGCENYVAPISPLAQTPQLVELLESRGLTRGRSWAKVYRGSEPVTEVPSAFRIESIGREHSAAFSDVVVNAFEMPPEIGPMVSGIVGQPGWHAYLGFEGDHPVSAAALHVSDGIGWLGFGCTLESHRNRGGQGAMFSRRMQDGLKLGCRWFVTETGEDAPESPNPSYHNMIRTGFKLAYLRPNYVHRGQSS